MILANLIDVKFNLVQLFRTDNLVLIDKVLETCSLIKHDAFTELWVIKSV